jgi:SAM-dependent methyltransferase
LLMALAEQRDWFADGEAYEHYVGRWSRPVARLFLNWLSIARGLRWLDVGCGTGALTQVILNHANPERVVGVEPSQGFLSTARKNVVDGRAEFRLGDAQALPVGDKEVDIAVSGLVLNFVPDKQHALNEMCRAVKPGGTIGAYVWDYSGDMQLMRYFWNGVRDLFPDGAERDEGRQFPICKPEALAELFRGVGLKAVDTCALDAPTVFSDFDDYWSPFLRGQGPAGAYCASLPEGDRVRLREHLKRTLPFNGDGHIDLIARAWAVRGML